MIGCKDFAGAGGLVTSLDCVKLAHWVEWDKWSLLSRVRTILEVVWKNNNDNNLGYLDVGGNIKILKIWPWLEQPSPSPEPPLLFACIYIPKTPTKQTFDTQLILILEKINSRGNEITFLGDLNIDVLKKGTHEVEYNQILQSFQLNQTIKEPTRVIPDSKRCIDHFMVNRTEFLSESGVIPVGISDHHLIYSIRKRDKKVGVTNTLK